MMVNLTKREVQALERILCHVGGCPDTTYRKDSDSAREKFRNLLRKADVPMLPWSDSLDAVTTTNSLVRFIK